MAVEGKVVTVGEALTMAHGYGLARGNMHGLRQGRQVLAAMHAASDAITKAAARPLPPQA